MELLSEYFYQINEFTSFSDVKNLSCGETVYNTDAVKNYESGPCEAQEVSIIGLKCYRLIHKPFSDLSYLCKNINMPV